MAIHISTTGRTFIGMKSWEVKALIECRSTNTCLSNRVTHKPQFFFFSHCFSMQIMFTCSTCIMECIQMPTLLNVVSQHTTTQYQTHYWDVFFMLCSPRRTSCLNTVNAWDLRRELIPLAWLTQSTSVYTSCPHNTWWKEASLCIWIPSHNISLHLKEHQPYVTANHRTLGSYFNTSSSLSIFLQCPKCCVF